MKSTLTLAFTVLSAASFAQIPVSAFNFDGTLSPFVDKSAGYVFDLDFRQNGSPTTSIGSPNYVWDTVGPIAKMVAEFEIDKFFRAWHGMQANGGGSYVNQFTILLDVYFEKDSLNPTGWASLFNTTADNQNDGDSFVRWDGYDGTDVFGSIGISSIYWPTLYANRWNRIVIAVNCGATTGRTFLDYYVNGTFLGQTNASGGLDGRWALYCYDDGDPTSDAVDILADNNMEKTRGKVSMVAFYDRVLTAAEAWGFGGPGRFVIPGDANLDGTVDIGDYALLSAAFNSSVGDSNWNENCDFDNDGTVDIGDFAILSANFGV